MHPLAGDLSLFLVVLLNGVSFLLLVLTLEGDLLHASTNVDGPVLSFEEEAFFVEHPHIDRRFCLIQLHINILSEQIGDFLDLGGTRAELEGVDLLPKDLITEPPVLSRLNDMIVPHPEHQSRGDHLDFWALKDL